VSGVTGDFGKLEELSGALRKLAEPAARKELSKNLAEEYRSFMEECFHEGHGPYGEKWAPLKFRTSAGGASQKPLADTGIMKGAATPLHVSESGFSVQVGKHYASTHQFGAVIRPKAAKALRFRGVTYVPTKNGGARRKYGNWIFVKSVTIPARPFAPTNGMPPELQARFDEAGDEFMREFLK
jgi:phage gpG-like protein